MSVLAYLDPASGSLIAATVAGGMAGVGVAVKSMWHNRTSRFRKGEAAGAPEAEQDEGSDASVDTEDAADQEDAAVDAQVDYATQDDN